MRIKLLYFIVILFTIVLYIPRIPLFTIPGISSILRLDTIATFIFSIFSFIYVIIYKKSIYLLFFIFYLIIFLYSNTMGMSIYAPTLLLYFSFFSIFLLFEDLVKLVKISSVIKYINIYLFLNILLHFISIITGFNISNNNLGTGEEMLILGPNGLMFAPYKFTILLVIGGLLNYFINKTIFTYSFLLIFISLIFSDSRAGFGAFLLILFFEILLFSKNKINKLLLGIIILLFSFYISFIGSLNIKSLNAFNNLNINEDASWLMRVESFNNWLNWLSPFKLLFGGGAQIFVTFVTQYGLPGPFDNLYLRLMSEVGVVGLILFFHFFLFYKNKNISSRIFIYATFWMCFFSFFNESFLAIKGGHIFWLLISMIKTKEFGIFFAKSNTNILQTK